MTSSDHEPLHSALRRLSDACASADKIMTPSPWKYDDKNQEIRTGDNHSVVTGGSVGYVNAWLNIDDDDAAAIVSTRNRLPELARILSDAAVRIDLLENLAIQHGAARDRLRDRADALEAAIQKACTLIDEGFCFSAFDHQVYQKVRDVLVSLRSALTQGEPVP